jgi:hypothetical protein
MLVRGVHSYHFIINIMLIGYTEILYHAEFLINMLMEKGYFDAKSKTFMLWYNDLYHEKRFVAG